VNPGSVDPLPGVSLESLLKQAELYDGYIKLIKQKEDGKAI
jgi:hypothetical protein